MKKELRVLIVLSVVVCVVILGTSAGGAMVESTPAEDSSGLEEVQALIDANRYEEAEEQARALLLKIEAVAGPDSLEVADVLDLLVSALWRGGKASEPEALELAERSLRIRQERLEPDDPRLADSIAGKANVLLKRFELEEAEGLFLQALELYRGSLGPGVPEVGEMHGKLGNVYYRDGDFESSRSEYEAALELAQIIHGSESLEASYLLRSLGNAVAGLDEVEEAESLYRSALSIQESKLSPDSEELGNTLNNLGLHLLNMGDFEAARESLVRAVAVKEAALGSEHPSLAMSVGNLAILYDQSGRVEAAEEQYERYLSIFEAALGPNHPYVAQAYGNYGSFLTHMSDYAGARDSYERALAIYEQALGPDHYQTGWMVMSMGYVMTLLGSYESAQLYFDRALRFWEEYPEQDAYMRGGTLERAGQLGLARDDLAVAREHFENAIAVYGEVYGKQYWRIGVTLENVGEIQLKMGELAKAEATLTRALVILKESLGSEHPQAAWAQVLIGDVRAASGDCTSALELYERALDIMKLSSLDSKETAEIPLRIARCVARQGAIEDAVKVALEGEQLARDHLRFTLAGLEERVGLQYVANRESGLDLALSLLVDKSIPEVAEQALDALIRSRAVVLDELAIRQNLIREEDPETTEIFEALGAARDRLAFLTVRGADDPENLETYQSLLREALNERDQAERALAERSRQFRQHQEMKTVGFEEVRRALPDAGGLVSYVRFLRHSVMSDDEEPYYLAIVLTENARQPVVVPLGPSDEIEKTIESFRASIAEEAVEGGFGGNQVEAEFRKLADRLSKRIWEPLVPHLTNVEELFVVPDGDLHFVPLVALPWGESEYFIDRGPRVHYLSAERDLASSWAQDSGIGLLAMGVPDFEAPGLFASLAPTESTAVASLADPELEGHSVFRGSRTSCESFDSMRFEALPATDAEVREVVALWNRGSADDSQGTEELLGMNASETNFKLKASGRKVLHLATHGFFLSEDCPSPLQGSRGGRQSSELKWIEIESPLLQTGLAMAGANNRGAAGSDEDDGILTAEEIAALDLRGVDWAVLSACETGLGELRAGEGVLGLRRAFQMAGVRTLIMSLWQVEDEPTREWMRRLYKYRFVDDFSTIAATRQASLDLLASRRAAGLSTHPFYWAGFVAAGDWR